MKTVRLSSPDDILDQLPQLEQEADYVVADGPGSNTETSRALLLRADLARGAVQSQHAGSTRLAQATKALKHAQDIRKGQPQALIVLSMVGKTYRLTQDMKDAAATLDLRWPRPPSRSSKFTPTRRDRAPSSGTWARAAARPPRKCAPCAVKPCRRRSPPKEPGGVPKPRWDERKRRGAMAARRPLVEGLKAENAVERALEEEFVYNSGPKKEPAPKPQPGAPAVETQAGKGRAESSAGRVPLTVRFRADYAAVLKRASLERQLQGIQPYTLQDILEEALEPWLRTHGYLS